MVEMEGKIKRWGNSMAVRFSKNHFNEAGLRPEQNVKVLVLPQRNVIADTFGMLKGRIKKSGQQLKDEIRKELHGV
jgi:antitoxin component of MazEF toxin-antitoxin module